jgi:hypothetical protein
VEQEEERVVNMAIVQDVVAAMRQAKELKHPMRAMRVTMECGHLRLTPEINTRMGIGTYTICRICPTPEGETVASRQVVNVEETGILHDDWFKEEGALRP